jgi:hypothetical protein
MIRFFKNGVAVVDHRGLHRQYDLHCSVRGHANTAPLDMHLNPRGAIEHFGKTPLYHIIEHKRLLTVIERYTARFGQDLFMQGGAGPLQVMDTRHHDPIDNLFTNYAFHFHGCHANIASTRMFFTFFQQIFYTVIISMQFQGRVGSITYVSLVTSSGLALYTTFIHMSYLHHIVNVVTTNDDLYHSSTHIFNYIHKVYWKTQNMNDHFHAFVDCKLGRTAAFDRNVDRR